MKAQKFGFVAGLAVFAPVLAAREALTNSGKGLWPAEILVGVTPAGLSGVPPLGDVISALALTPTIESRRRRTEQST